MTVDPGSTHELRAAFTGFVDEHRAALYDSLDGLTEDEARRSLVPSRTTLLGLLKHVTFVERVWYDEAITGRTRREIGIAATPDRSFVLSRTDTITSVRADHREACAASRAATATLGLDDVVAGRGARPVWRIHLHMVRELARHAGHADILREQVLAARSAPR